MLANGNTESTTGVLNPTYCKDVQDMYYAYLYAHATCLCTNAIPA